MFSKEQGNSRGKGKKPGSGFSKNASKGDDRPRKSASDKGERGGEKRRDTGDKKTYTKSTFKKDDVGERGPVREKRAGAGSFDRDKSAAPRGERKYDRGDTSERGPVREKREGSFDRDKSASPRGERKYDRGDASERGPVREKREGSFDRDKSAAPRGDRKYDRGDSPDRGPVREKRAGGDSFDRDKSASPRGERKYDRGDSSEHTPSRSKRSSSGPFDKENEESDTRGFTKGPRTFKQEDTPFSRRKPVGDAGKSTSYKAYKERSNDDDAPRKYKPESESGKSFDSAKRPYGKGKKTATPSSSSDGLTRLNKYLADAGIASRRKADELIISGEVTVNGVVVTEMGYKVSREDKVTFNGQPLKREKQVYVLLNKPKDYITTTEDPQERRTVMELVKSASRERIYPVGRLDRNTTGLLLMTNDGDLAQKMAHPKHEVRKLYHVTLDKPLRKVDFDKIVKGLELEDGEVQVDELAYVEGATKKEVGIEIHSGKNRIVRRIFEHLGYDVVKLDRSIYAGLTKKDLPRGRWRYLTDEEVMRLKHYSKH